MGEHMAHKKETSNADNILDWKSQGKIPLGQTKANTGGLY